MSIIIPARNEAATLASTIAAIGDSAAEIILVDAGSSDETIGIAKSLGALVWPARRQQRASQLNLGAQNSRAEILLFLHADTSLPPGALDQIAQALEDHGVVGGAFVRRYASCSKFLQATCLLARCRNHIIGWHLGDQAMFVRRSAFVELNGFREVDQFEDLDFSRRLTSLGRVVTLQPGVTSSSRRFAGGAIGRTACDFGLTIRYLLRGLPTDSK
ncbi:MAG: glycosyltransferase [Verrucomicrobiota bacterium]|nr:glycosyltransferase [Verrucomicrobiota bacterium]